MTDVPTPADRARDPHPALDSLAEYAEGLLPRSGAAAVTRHLDRCPRCRADLAGLGAVTTALGAAPDPGPVPAEVAARVEHALAAAGTPGDLVATAYAAGSRRDTRRSPLPLRSRLAGVLPRLIVAASATAVVALGGWVALSGRDGGDLVAGEGAEAGDEAGADSAAELGGEPGLATAESSPEQQVEAPARGGPAPAAGGPGPAVEDELARLVREAAELRGERGVEGGGGCGAALAAELGRGVLSASGTTVRGRTAVLVLLGGDPEGPGDQAWVLPDCDAGVGEALAVLPAPAG